MKSASQLKTLLLQIDHKSYPLYKQTKGSYEFKDHILTIDHVQGDPFASPSHVTISLSGNKAAFPGEYYSSRHRRIALQDYLTRLFHISARRYDKKARGSGKSGVISTCCPGQEILERSACHIDEKSGDISYRLHIGFPAFGRTINSGELIKILFDFLPECINEALIYGDRIKKDCEKVIFLSDDTHHIRQELKERQLCAFIADGSILPRASGISSLPMKEAIPFKSPESLKITLDLPHRGKVSGMGIKKGITLIVGGGYHGKSTLLKALELGVYDHIEGDGRELAITDDSAVKIRAEDGRCVHGSDISLFIKNLPDNKDTVNFHTEDASGSTSQAANVMEAISCGSKLLLIDEDTCATNFMIRDELMQKVISKDKEPITPFIERILPFSKKEGISTILVAGSFGAYFHPADLIIQMDNYRVLDITGQAKEASKDYPPAFSDNSTLLLPDNKKIPHLTKKFDICGRIKTKTLGTDGFSIDHDTVELRYLEQLTESGQSAALCKAVLYCIKNYFDDKNSLLEMLQKIIEKEEKNGPDFLCGQNYVSEGLSFVRLQELYACFCRCRFISSGDKDKKNSL